MRRKTCKLFLFIFPGFDESLDVLCWREETAAEHVLSVSLSFSLIKRFLNPNDDAVVTIGTAAGSVPEYTSYVVKTQNAQFSSPLDCACGSLKFSSRPACVERDGDYQQTQLCKCSAF